MNGESEWRSYSWPSSQGAFICEWSLLIWARMVRTAPPPRYIAALRSLVCCHFLPKRSCQNLSLGLRNAEGLCLVQLSHCLVWTSQSSFLNSFTHTWGLPCPNGPLGFPSGSTCEIKVITFLDRFSLSCIYGSKGSRSGDGRGMALKEGIVRPQQQNQDFPYSSVACSSVFCGLHCPFFPACFLHLREALPALSLLGFTCEQARSSSPNCGLNKAPWPSHSQRRD